jgi:transcriptional regulator with XRE-family HTH domain
MSIDTITSVELAKRLGVSRSALWKWTQEQTLEGERLRACILHSTRRSTTWSVQRLTERGWLREPEAAPQPALQFSYTLQAVGH